METRVCIPGHMQRGGSPSAYDRVLATQWHPERLLDEGMLPIWQWFIRRCNAKKEGDSL